MTSAPASTYRIQVRESFDLDAVAGVVPYLADLGVGWVYLSPVLEAEPGSDHGYDVVDHGRVDPARGGDAAFRRAADAAHAAGLGVLVDIVPNHVGVLTPRVNGWWWNLLQQGRASRYAEAFDVDWEAGAGRVRIPVLGSADDLLALEVVEADGERQLAYHDHRFPIAAGTADDGADARTVHDRQHYELVHWRREQHDLNYRRFFAVSSLAAIRVEVPWVFEESHREILRWAHDGLIDGLRVDHPDGLADPGGYLDRLAAETGLPVWVEKILEPGEQLPPHWATVGTTGYDALGDVDRVLVDGRGRLELERVDARLAAPEPRPGRRRTPKPAPPPVWRDLIHDAKRGVADRLLGSEVQRLARMLAPQLALDHDRIADAVAELLACFPVYRSYVPYGTQHLHEAAAEAIRRRADLGKVIRAVVAVLADPAQPAAIRFQQTSGMVMAKGVEDTAFYRYSRLTSLNEVGGDPSEFSLGVRAFHRRQARRQASWPQTLTTLSTHDTKRGEDVRARIDALSEVPRQWGAIVAGLHARHPLGDGPVENLLWQAVVGAWPIERPRMHAYAEKASREANTSTGWLAVNEQFEQRMHSLVDAVYDDPQTAGLIADAVGLVAHPGRVNALCAKLVQLTIPGVPDVYQGSELWERSLVDPDNRRAVDFGERRGLLRRIDEGWLPPLDESAAAKLLVVTRALRLRRAHPERFARYVSLEAIGPAAAHVIAYDRGGAVTVATRLPAGLQRDGGWGRTELLLPGRSCTDVLTGTTHPGGPTPLAALLAHYPVALLTVDGGAS